MSQSDLTTVSIATDYGVLQLEQNVMCSGRLQLDTQDFFFSFPNATQVLRKNPIRILFKTGNKVALLISGPPYNMKMKLIFLMFLNCMCFP